MADLNITSSGRYSLISFVLEFGKLGWSKRPVLEAQESPFTPRPDLRAVPPEGKRLKVLNTSSPEKRRYEEAGKAGKGDGLL